MPVPPGAVDRVVQLAGEDGNMEIEFEYRGTTYSTSDLDPTQNNEIDDEDGVRIRNEQQFLADWEVGEFYTQFALKKGLKIYGEGAEKGVIKEFLQFKKQDVLRPTSIEKLTPEKIRRALRLIMVVKEKRDGTIKVRGVADGSGQRGFIDEVYATSPTVSTEALAITCAIDAFERRAVLTVDIPGAYLHCFMDSEEYILIKGVLVDLYLDADPSAKEKVTVDKYGKKRLYAQMNKALYGHMRSGRLFYEHLSATLKKMGFNPNPDELCVWNKNVNGKQMTVVLYVDDLKVSFHSEEGLNEFIRDLEKMYGKLEPNRDYCGITMDYTIREYVNCRLKDTSKRQLKTSKRKIEKSKRVLKHPHKLICSM